MLVCGKAKTRMYAVRHFFLNLMLNYPRPSNCSVVLLRVACFIVQPSLYNYLHVYATDKKMLKVRTLPLNIWALKYESKQNNKKYDKKIHYELVSPWHTFYPEIHSQAAIWSSSNIQTVSLYFKSSLSHLILTVMVFLYRAHPFFYSLILFILLHTSYLTCSVSVRIEVSINR